MTLNQTDRNKIKKEMIIGNIASIIIIFGVLIFDIIQFVKKDEIDFKIILIINFSVLLLSYLVNFLLNSKYRKDLKFNLKISRIEKVTEKLQRVDYEAGSGTLYIPILGDLFPKLWGQEMKKEEIQFLKVNNELIETNSSIYDSIEIGNKVEVFETQFSKIILEVEKT